MFSAGHHRFGGVGASLLSVKWGIIAFCEVGHHCFL